MKYTIEKFASDTWLKELKKALDVPGFKITPPKEPLDIDRAFYTDKQIHNITVARALIEATAAK